MLGRALCIVVWVVLVAACAHGSPGRPDAVSDQEAARLRAELETRSNELAEARGELTRLESTLRATKMERDARSASRSDALSDQSARIEVLEDVADSSRRQFADVLATNERLGSLRACAQSLDTALNEAAVSGPHLVELLHDAQRACDQAGLATS